MEETEIFSQLSAIAAPTFAVTFGDDSERAIRIAEHKAWLGSIRRERPATNIPYKVGIYIRYFNQTKYDNYLSYHKKQFADTVALCPQWTLVDFYIDEGASAPNMENAPEWSRLIDDAMSGRVNLIITQKVSNVSKKMQEITVCSRMLAKCKPPVGIYFISEDIFTLASYYTNDRKDEFFYPYPEWKLLPDDGEGTEGLLHD